MIVAMVSTMIATMIVRPQPRPEAELRLFCFHHAGGGAAFFAPWAAALPRHIELVAIRLPGRESAFAQPRFTSVEQGAEVVASAMLPWLDRPFALFGHSLGALVAYRTALTLAVREDKRAQHLFCSGFRAPHLPRSRMLAALPDADLVSELKGFGGIPDAVAEHQELLDLMIPLFRDDLRLAEDYVHDGAAPLATPITAMAGEGDDLVPRHEVEGWESHTSGLFRLITYPGSHFFPVEQQARVIADITKAV
jgi:surfactin synthase thioesterase subunit